MGFIDEAEIIVASGDGGKGCVSFRREKFIPKGGPDGGDGGKGGDVVIRATNRLHTLSDLSHRRHFKAQNGRPGKGKRQSGKNGLDVIIEVPLGTIIYDCETGDMLADFIRNDQEIGILFGGQGGKGNTHFKTSTNRTPRMAQTGQPGKVLRLKLSLKYLADIGLIGLPNAGKSTLLSRLTTANPKIDSYPFTTITPNLGVIEFDDSKTLTIADIPGLIEGASEGRGLGHRFLKHIERTRFLLHLIDVSYVPVEDILEDFNMLQDELSKFNPSLVEKDQMVLINKIDIRSAETRDVEVLRKAFSDMNIKTYAISALTGEGIDNLKSLLARKFFNE
jgi:GTP-binding protein